MAHGTGDTVSASAEEDTGEFSVVGPLENPAMEGNPDDPLLDPHPSEPGVKGDGGFAAPLENPGRPRS
ncbi:MAG: hypothetical protein ACRDL3_07000 [Solirubrobacterales bacterium]